MQLSYQECYDKFTQSYGTFENWPLPYAYSIWFATLAEGYQAYYLNPAGYAYLYDWARQLTAIQTKKDQKPSRSQKRKLKKKNLQQEYDRQKAVIGKWVDKQRKDLVIGLQKIEQQQKKTKQKKQKKLSHLIEIHKEVYKHHMKRKNTIQNPNKRVETKDRKKRMSVIKKMKQIFQSRKQKVFNDPSNRQENKTQEELLEKQELKSKQTLKQKSIKEQDDQYEDLNSDEDNQEKSKGSNLPTVSFPIIEIEYNNIGKLSGKIYNDISLRQWVTNVPNPQLQQISLKIINRLAYKQAIKKVNNPQKARKIIVSGLKECKRTLTTFLQNKRSKCLIVALNIERNNLIKGVDDQIQKCITLGQESKIPVIHVSTRSKLGRAFTGKFGPRISIVSIVNYEGYQDYVEQLLSLWKKSCQQYQKLP